MKQKVYPTIRQVIVFVLLAVLLDLIAGLILGAINAERTIDELLGAILTIINYLIVFWYFRRRSKMQLGKMFALNQRVVFSLPVVVLTMLGAIILASEVGNLVLALLPVPQWLNDILADVVLGGGFSMLTVFVVVIIPAVFEEIMFRGIILRGLLRNYSASVSILVSAVLFGFIHLNPWQFVGGTLIGILLGWVAVKTDSIVPTIVMHFMNNFILLVASLASDVISIPGFNAGVDVGQSSFQPWWFDLIGLLLFGIGITVLWWVFRQLKPVPDTASNVA